MTLDDRHHEAIIMRYHNKTYAQIAKRFNIKVDTVRSWVMDSDFKAEEERFRTSIRTRVKRKLLKLTDKAVDSLYDALEGKKVNVKAIELIFKYAKLEETQQQTQSVIIDDIVQKLNLLKESDVDSNNDED